mmetsp:Transcript_71230/g.201872  ORF Transcript_71230/g.201872 Transcript_71230/m.201872 type:complete len:245 (+) Transcript_71230:1010-1744(+)
MQPGNVRHCEVEDLFPAQLRGVKYHRFPVDKRLGNVLGLDPLVSDRRQTEILQAFPNELGQCPPQLLLRLEPGLDAGQRVCPRSPLLLPEHLGPLGPRYPRGLLHCDVGAIPHCLRVRPVHPGVGDVEVELPGPRHGVQRLQHAPLLAVLGQALVKLAAGPHVGLHPLGRRQGHEARRQRGQDNAAVQLLGPLEVHGKLAHPRDMVVLGLEADDLLFSSNGRTKGRVPRILDPVGERHGAVYIC